MSGEASPPCDAPAADGVRVLLPAVSKYSYADEAYFPDPRIVNGSNDAHMPGEVRPLPRWARALSLAFICAALALTISTLGLEINMCLREEAKDVRRLWDDVHSSPLPSFVLLFIICGLADCAASVVTLVVCLALTAAPPHRVLMCLRKHTRNCLCATVCIIGCASSTSIALFATMCHEQCCSYPVPLPVPIVRTILIFAYFGVLMAFSI